MGFVLLGVGLLLFMAAYQNNVAALGSQLYSDISGGRGFLIWVVALFIIGALGYIPALKSVSRVFLVLILVVIFLSNRGIFQQLTAALGVAHQDSDSQGGMPNMPDQPQQPVQPAQPGSQQ